MNLNDILTLAHAGYTAEQINQFAQPQVQQMQMPQQMPQQMQMPQQRVPNVPLTFDIKKTDPNEAMKQMANALASAQQANLALLSGKNPTLSQVQTADDVTSQIIKEGI